MNCTKCNQPREVVSALVEGTYYSNICKPCVAQLSGDYGFSSGAQSFDRRRTYEDYAQDTVQPYNASGPNAEFYRLYPKQAEKIFTKAEVEQVRRKI